jgi:hypothetical protein
MELPASQLSASQACQNGTENKLYDIEKIG